MNNIILSPVSIDILIAEIAKEVTKLLVAEHYLSTQNQEKDDGLLTRKEAANFLKISLPTVSDWTTQGAIVGHRIGRRVRYKKSELLTSLKKIQTINSK